MELPVWTVSSLTNYLKQVLDSDEVLRNTAVKGEISNANPYPSGHLYFTLKDSQSQISCVMFNAEARGLRFQAKDGMKVLALGRVSIYEKKGQYQLVVNELRPEGVGELFVAYQQLKERLQQEGLFDEARKKPLPLFPKMVGIITSPQGAALHDMVSIITRRNPGVQIVVAPAVVQGEEAPASLLAALALMQRVSGLEVMIMGRGGGSLEELWAFNSEDLARALAACPIPVISAVGHETDFTIADFVADVRAPTPSGAAELVVPDEISIRTKLRHLGERVILAMEKRMSREARHLQALATRPVFQNPLSRIQSCAQTVDDLARRLRTSVSHSTALKGQKINAHASQLAALSPLNVLKRGYCLCFRLETGELVKSALALRKKDNLDLSFLDGKVAARVTRGADEHTPLLGRLEATVQEYVSQS